MKRLKAKASRIIDEKSRQRVLVSFSLFSLCISLRHRHLLTRVIDSKDEQLGKEGAAWDEGEETKNSQRIKGKRPRDLLNFYTGAKWPVDKVARDRDSRRDRTIESILAASSQAAHPSDRRTGKLWGVLVKRACKECVPPFWLVVTPYRPPFALRPCGGRVTHHQAASCYEYNSLVIPLSLCRFPSTTINRTLRGRNFVNNLQISRISCLTTTWIVNISILGNFRLSQSSKSNQQQQRQQQEQNINFREKEKQILDKILGPQYYDRRIRPAGANGTGKRPSPPLKVAQPLGEKKTVRKAEVTSKKTKTKSLGLVNSKLLVEMFLLRGSLSSSSLPPTRRGWRTHLRNNKEKDEAPSAASSINPINRRKDKN